MFFRSLKYLVVELGFRGEIRINEINLGIVSILMVFWVMEFDEIIYE